MNTKRLLKLAAFLDQLPPQKFDFSSVVVEGEKHPREALKARNESCGTTACAMGWTPAVFPRLVKWERERDWFGPKLGLRLGRTTEYTQIAARLFAITLDEAHYLFTPGPRVERYSGLSERARATTVARHIRAFVKRGGMPRSPSEEST